MAATRQVTLVLAALLALAAPAVAQEGAWTGNVSLLAGGTWLDHDAWRPTDQHLTGGLLLDFGPREWPVSVALDLLHGAGDGTDAGVRFESTTTEIDAGFRKIFDMGPFRPFFGSGLAVVQAEFQGLGQSDSDTGFGVWVDSGVYVTLGGSVNVGLDLRYSTARVTLFDIEADAGGSAAGLVFGYRW